MNLARYEPDVLTSDTGITLLRCLPTLISWDSADAHYVSVVLISHPLSSNSSFSSPFLLLTHTILGPNLSLSACFPRSRPVDRRKDPQEHKISLSYLWGEIKLHHFDDATIHIFGRCFCICWPDSNGVYLKSNSVTLLRQCHCE